MAQDGRNLKFRLYTALFFLAVSIVLPYTSKALKPLSHEELLNNSANKETVIHNKPYDAVNIPEHKLTRKKPEDIKPYAISPVSEEATPEAVPGGAYLHSSFNHFVCHQCHSPGDINAADKTRKQWRVLIGNNAHSIFKPIPWVNQEEKNNVLQYLLEHAQNTNLRSEGIGVWR